MLVAGLMKIALHLIRNVTVNVDAVLDITMVITLAINVSYKTIDTLVGGHQRNLEKFMALIKKLKFEIFGNFFKNSNMKAEIKGIFEKSNSIYFWHEI